MNNDLQTAGHCLCTASYQYLRSKKLLRYNRSCEQIIMRPHLLCMHAYTCNMHKDNFVIAMRLILMHACMVSWLHNFMQTPIIMHDCNKKKNYNAILAWTPYLTSQLDLV